MSDKLPAVIVCIAWALLLIAVGSLATACIVP